MIIAHRHKHKIYKHTWINRRRLTTFNADPRIEIVSYKRSLSVMLFGYYMYNALAVKLERPFENETKEGRNLFFPWFFLLKGRVLKMSSEKVLEGRFDEVIKTVRNNVWAWNIPSYTQFSENNKINDKEKDNFSGYRIFKKKKRKKFNLCVFYKYVGRYVIYKSFYGNQKS